MHKGQRPSRHTRLLRTKRGYKITPVNWSIKRKIIRKGARSIRDEFGLKKKIQDQIFAGHKVTREQWESEGKTDLPSWDELSSSVQSKLSPLAQQVVRYTDAKLLAQAIQEKTWVLKPDYDRLRKRQEYFEKKKRDLVYPDGARTTISRDAERRALQDPERGDKLREVNAELKLNEEGLKIFEDEFFGKVETELQLAAVEEADAYQMVEREVRKFLKDDNKVAVVVDDILKSMRPTPSDIKVLGTSRDPIRSWLANLNAKARDAKEDELFNKIRGEISGEEMVAIDKGLGLVSGTKSAIARELEAERQVPVAEQEYTLDVVGELVNAVSGVDPVKDKQEMRRVMRNIFNSGNEVSAVDIAKQVGRDPAIVLRRKAEQLGLSQVEAARFVSNGLNMLKREGVSYEGIL